MPDKELSGVSKDLNKLWRGVQPELKELKIKFAVGLLKCAKWVGENIDKDLLEHLANRDESKIYKPFTPNKK